MLLSFFTMALSELPWATTTTLFPDLMAGTIYCYQYGITLSIVIFKLWINFMLLMFLVKELGRHLCIFDLILDVFRHLTLIMVVECRNFFSKSEPVIFRVFKRFQVCW